MNNNNNNNTDFLITQLYKWCTSYNNQPLLKDTTRLRNTPFDAYIDSSISSPLSFTIFELSDNGELIIDSPQKILESKAAFFVFINPKTGWIFSIKNTLENQKKLITKQAIQNFKIKVVE